MRVYVATKWKEKVRAREVMAALRSAGHDITYDWTQAELNGVPEPTQAQNDRTGVMTADALVFIAEKDLAYKGAWVEFGMACARNIPVYILGANYTHCIFHKLLNVHPVKSLQAVLDGLDQQVPAISLM